MAYAFATVDDLRERGCELSETDEPVAATLLDDAGLVLRTKLHIDFSDAELLDRLKVVSCNMVSRAVSAARSQSFGVDQATATMGPFQQTFHYADAYGGLRLLPSDRDLLGLDGGYISTIPVAIRGRYGCNS